MNAIDPTAAKRDAAHAFMLDDEDFAYDDSEARGHLAEGRPIFYLEPNTPKGLVVRERPDGGRDLVELDDQGGYRVVGPA
jgi:hypothetical protein